jgi:uncharacterized protein (TIGR02271 family)
MFEDWIGATVAGTDGRAFGTLEDLFVGRTSGEPEFGVVSLAGGGRDRVVVPLTGARRLPEGVAVGFDSERALAAPRMQSDVEEIPAEVGAMIHDRFGLDAPPPPAAPAPASSDTPTAVMPASDEPAEVVVSEEQLAVETRSVPTERVRLHKRVVTEDVTVTVTVRREELVIEREPIAGTSHQAAEGDFPLPTDSGEVEFVLHAEEPVVSKRVVPVERVTVNKNTITEERRIAETVRRERVDVDETPVTSPQEDIAS